MCAVDHKCKQISKYHKMLLKLEADIDILFIHSEQVDDVHLMEQTNKQTEQTNKMDM